MTVVPIKSLPLGFRFHPTDEELVHHYLKRKINGKIRSEMEVIPEIDVCKCEPWDLPDRALIESDDPEWFFFSPKDRKYPNGHRANRATKAGYWKATGKDRFIRSKAPAVVIGMKKTLVFHRGRAPKGVRTNWIMHEYRTTEPEFESGEQGGYVLYRLFRKPEESAPVYNVDEMERSDLSITPYKSSPSETQNEVDAFEEHETPATLQLNQVSPISYIQENTIFQDAFNMPNNNDSLNSKVGFNNYTTIEQRGSVDPLLLEALGQMDSNGFPNITSPICSYDDHSFLGNVNQESNKGLFPTNFDEPDPMNDLLNSILSNEDESLCENEGVGHTDPGWFLMDASDDYSGINRALYENTNRDLFSYDIAGFDDYSMDSGSESLQGLFGNMDESNAQFNSENTPEENATTGIQIRPRQPPDDAPNNTPAQQGYANRRIRLQVSSFEFESFEFQSIVKPKDDEKISETEEVEKKTESGDLGDMDDALGSAIRPTHADDVTVEFQCYTYKPNLRLRTRTAVETSTSDERKDLVRNKEIPRHPMSSFNNVVFVTVLMMMMIVVLLSVGMSIWKRGDISVFEDF